MPNLGGDNSNAEFAIWALDAAAKSGAEVAPATWEAALQCWIGGQNPDGSWGYSRQAPGTGSMTASGIASVSICLAQLTTDERKPTAAEQGAVERGLEWMASHFSVGQTPGSGQWLFYYAVMLRRAADATGTKRLGDHDWHREFAELLVSHQNRLTGSWKGVGGQENDSTLATSMVLLTLAGVEGEPKAPR